MYKHITVSMYIPRTCPTLFWWCLKSTSSKSRRTHTYIHTCTHKHLYPSSSSWNFAMMSEIPTDIHIYVYIHIHIYIHASMYIHTYPTNLSSHFQTYIYTCIYLSICIYFTNLSSKISDYAWEDRAATLNNRHLNLHERMHTHIYLYTSHVKLEVDRRRDMYEISRSLFTYIHT